MRATKQMSVTLPSDVADNVRAKVEAGAYASESDVVREGLRALQVRDRAVERWLREDVAAAYDAMMADPSRAISSDELKAFLAEVYARTAKTHE